MRQGSFSSTKLLISALVLSAGLAVPGLPAHADTDPGIMIQNMTMDVRPEYDTSDVFIAYDFSLTNTGSQPYSGEVQFHVPKGATNQVHICEQINGNKHAKCQPYNTKDDADSTLMTWKPSNPIQPGQSYPIYVEYYYNPIQGTTNKTINFLYHPSYPVQNLNLTVTQPLRSSNWKIDPAPAGSGGTSDGMTSYNYFYKDLQAGKPVQLAISYTKADNRPSIAKTASAASDTTGMSATTKIVIGAVALAIFGGLLFLGMRRPTTRRPSPRPASQARPAEQPRPAQAQAPVAVHQARAQRQEPRQKPARQLSAADEKRQARQLLLEGKISEATYRELIADLAATEAR